jgi:cation transport ATPase
MKNCTVFSKTCIDCGRSNLLRILKNVRNVQRSKNESQRDTERRLFYLITTMLTTNVLFCITLYVGHLSPSIAKDALLHTVVIFVAVSKRI